jgi:hypothetical protein
MLYYKCLKKYRYRCRRENYTVITVKCANAFWSISAAKVFYTKNPVSS